ncbi:MAG: hypothetical protein LKF99_00355 [Bifidobacterium sp.]|jgi:hypothetical protein|nr:hypothetical protein [Bifidobacterium sp.]
MQTLPTSTVLGERQLIRAIPSKHRMTRRLASVLAIGLLLSLSACATPRLEGRTEAGLLATACGQAYQQARDAQHAMTAKVPRMMRLFAAAAASRHWIDAAATCPQRFDEGTIRAAQAMQLASALASSVGTSYITWDPPRGGLDAVTSLNADIRALQAVVIAEDRAGFAVEFLAARASPHATLAISDDHKATASRLFSLARASSDTLTDPRRKIYSLDRLLANPSSMIDESTGLEVPTMAAVEISCAREEIAAADSAEFARTPATRSSLRILSQLAASRAARALIFGYPSFDAALFL